MLAKMYLKKILLLNIKKTSIKVQNVRNTKHDDIVVTIMVKRILSACVYIFCPTYGGQRSLEGLVQLFLLMYTCVCVCGGSQVRGRRGPR